VVAAPAIPQVTIVEQPRRPTLLGHFFHLEKLHWLVNYSVPVHYPKQQQRGPCCYGSAYFAYMLAKSQSPPALIATPGGAPLVGPDRLQFDNDERLGWRFTLGTWCDYAQTVGVEVSYMAFAEREPTFAANNVIQVEPVTAPLLSTRITALSRFWTGDLNVRRELCRGCFGHIDCLAGIRVLSLVEDLRFVNQDAPPLPPVTRFQSFRTENTLLGGQVGLDGELLWHYGSLHLWGKTGLANIHQRLVLSDVNGGVEPLAEGTFARNRPAVFFEGGAFLGIQLCSCVRLSAGYTFIYVADVIRPADQIDNDVTTFRRGDSAYWVQGLNAGLEFRF
jgi:hypothetical protein